MKILKGFVIGIVILTIIYFLGPQVEKPVLDRELPQVSHYLYQLESDVTRHEKKTPHIKPDNEARIIWADSAYTKTSYSLVYLHGFSASQKEGDPLHKEIAERYGCNLYLSRLYAHGVEESEAMEDLTVEKMINSAKEAIAIGEQLGGKVILLSTSTGGTLGLYLAGGDPKIAGLILYSPNIEIFDPNAWVLDEHWGLQIARVVKGGNYNEWELDKKRKQYWTSKYRLEALTQLEEMIDVTMNETTFEKVTQPVFLGYYYKSEAAQDSTVSVDAMLEMYAELGTPDSLKRKVAFPNARHHVIASSLTSHDLTSVREETFKFLEEIMHLKPLKPKVP